MVRPRLPALVIVAALCCFTNSRAEIVADSNAAYFACERADIVISAPQGFQLLTSEPQREGYACAVIPDGESYADPSLALTVNHYKVRGVCFQRVLEQDTANMQTAFGRILRFEQVDGLSMGKSDTLMLFRVHTTQVTPPFEYIGYLNVGPDLLVIELTRTSAQTLSAAENLLQKVAALARVLTRAADNPSKSGGDHAVSPSH